MTSLKDIKEQIIKIKTDITDIDIAESKIQLKRISLQPNSREREGTYRTQEREKEPTEPKREREKEPTEPKRGRRNLLNSRERRNLLNSRGRRNQLNSRERDPSEAPLKQCITADKPPYQRASSESRQAHSHRIPSFPIAIP